MRKLRHVLLHLLGGVSKEEHSEQLQIQYRQGLVNAYGIVDEYLSWKLKFSNDDLNTIREIQNYVKAIYSDSVRVLSRYKRRL